MLPAAFWLATAQDSDRSSGPLLAEAPETRSDATPTSTKAQGRCHAARQYVSGGETKDSPSPLHVGGGGEVSFYSRHKAALFQFGTGRGGALDSAASGDFGRVRVVLGTWSA